MKMSEILVGHTYSNGRGRVRKIVDEGPQYKLYDGQTCTNNVLYEVVNDGTKHNRTAGEQHVSTRQTMASWAKEEVADTECST